MWDVDGLQVRPDGIHTHEQLLGALERLRVRAARGRGKCRLSLTDVAAMSGVPRSTLANYLSGASFVPADQLDSIVLALGVAPDEAALWAAAWERVAERRIANKAPPEESGGRHVLQRPRWMTSVAGLRRARKRARRSSSKGSSG
ncbi:MAG TPA: helix-turn-helix transcriptional regulator [Actinophytocola sp.]|uniref:helix-turn-helix domain-containing protein n=1 Tax=Actinophytocola sp. TaxID=1872138 RepID=UPI002DDD148C|nr:helix-turn-helix transcriptional regulator [Actinophytocola sp.]HEV2780087.1 helix-turn-helix transcriptional regulator [Actinophytocola sp.]